MNCSVVVPVRLESAHGRWSQWAHGPDLPYDSMDRLSQIEFGRDTLDSMLMEQISYLDQMGIHIDHILLGRDFYYRLCKETSEFIRHPVSFRTPPEWCRKTTRVLAEGEKGDYFPADDKHYDPATDTFTFLHYMSFQVHLIPWMQGCLCLPKLDTTPYYRDVETPPKVSAAGVDDVEIKDPELRDRILAHLRTLFVQATNKPLPPGKFLRTKRFLWWWY